MQRFRLTPPAVKLSENMVERQCLDLLRRRNYWPARLHVGTFKSIDGQRWIRGLERGTPDYGALHELFPGFLLETKRPGAAARPEQRMKQWELKAGYRLAIVTVDSVESLATWLNAHETAAKAKWAQILQRPVRGP